ncbi:MAG TPA: hypothetical protein VGL37_03250 [Solirubrobacteraceae bacterium]|jgi:hypothetical protein
MTARRLALSLTISLAVLVLPTAAAQAAGCTGDTWYGPGGSSTEAKSGAWGEASNWSAGLPEGTTQVCITAPGTYTVTLSPYPSTHYAGDVGGAAANLTLGASSGSQTLQIIGEGFGYEGDWYNQTYLDVGGNLTVGADGQIVLDATESNAPHQTGEPHGGSVLLEQDSSGVRNATNTLVNEGKIVAQSSSSKWDEGIASRLFTNRGSLQVASGKLILHNNESETSSGAIGTAAGATLAMTEMSTFTNSGSFENAGSTTFSGYPSHGRWVQGSDAIDGNAIEIQSGGGLEDSATSGAGAFTFGNGDSGYLLGTIPKTQTITLASTTGQCTLFLGNDTLINEGTLHLDVPAGSESNTNVEEGSLVNEGSIYGTVEGTKAKNVIDVALANEPAGTLTSSSGTLFDNRELTNNGSVEIPSGTLLELVAMKFVNGAAGTIAPQIAGPSTFGEIGLRSGAVIEAAGTLAPTLTGGFTPSVGEEFDVVEGAAVHGAFANVLGGFTADYTHESSESPYLGVVYGSSGGGVKTGTTGPGTTTAQAKVDKATAAKGRVSVELTCPTGGGACGKATVKVTITEHLKHGRIVAISAGKHPKSTEKVLVIATGSISLAAGKTATLSLPLNAAGAKLLKKYRKLQALATVSTAGKTLGTQKVTITAAKAHGKHK